MINDKSDYKDFLLLLENGDLRVAEKVSGQWIANPNIKQKILDIFKYSEIVDVPGGFCDKEPLIPRSFSKKDLIRLVPGGTSVRAGAFVGKNVVVMPPSYINIGAYVDDGTMIDSHVLVGSCAQIGKRVHVSAGVQIGGVLEPIGNRPVVIEDDCFIGANSVIVEGVLIREKAVIAPGVILSASVPIYDLIHKTIRKREVPERAVVVQGARLMNQNSWSKEQGLSVSCPVIIKYRDEKTDLSVALEEALRLS